MPALIEHYACVGVSDKLDLSDDFPVEGRWVDNIYHASLLFEFPPSRPLPPKLPLSLFCLPSGLRPSATPRPPSFACFVLTLADGERMYGHCLTVHEALPEHAAVQLITGENTAEDAEKRFACIGELGGGATFFAPRCLCIISRLHFPLAFKASLLSLHHMCEASKQAPLRLAVETALSHMILNVPLPLPGGPTVRFCLGNDQPSLHVRRAWPRMIPTPSQPFLNPPLTRPTPPLDQALHYTQPFTRPTPSPPSASLHPPLHYIHPFT